MIGLLHRSRHHQRQPIAAAAFAVGRPHTRALSATASLHTTESGGSPSSRNTRNSLFQQPRTLLSSSTLSSAMTARRLSSLAAPPVSPTSSPATPASSTAWQPHPTLPCEVFTAPIEKSANDDRTYRLVRLPNGLEAMLIHDAHADKAAAAMDVGVGHLSDPDNLPGLAHFNEHMLFLGTEKYPRENEYNEYLTQNNGESNAYTDMADTNFHFSVSPFALEGALDRFAQFFIAPLFTPSCTEREVRAVESENKKNLQVDMWRLFQLDKSLVREGHPLAKFGTGNWETLWETPRREGRDPRQELIDWYNTHFSARIMKLVVLGTDSLDELEKMVVDKFSPIQNRDVPAVRFPSDAWGAEHMGSIVSVKTLKDSRVMDITFPFPEQSPLHRTKPGSFLSHLLGHEGSGSLLSYLKSLGLTNGLSAGFGHSAPGFEFFRVTIDLSAHGLANWPLVYLATFQYIRMLREGGPLPEWAFKEVLELAHIGFRFKEKGQPAGYASSTARLMQKPYPREWVLSGAHLPRVWDEKLVRECLDALVPERSRITIASREAAPGLGQWDKTEKWYGTEYRVDRIPEELLQKIKEMSLIPELHLPKPNAFIPENFFVDKKDVPEPAKRPTLVRDTELSRLWHKKDDWWWVPKANAMINMRNPIIDSTVENAVKSRLFADLLTDALTEYSYDAEVAGLSYRIEGHADGLLLQLGGYDDKLPVLLRVVIEKIRDFAAHVDDKRFDIIKDMTVRAYANFQMDAPYTHANVATYEATQEIFWAPRKKLKALEGITAQDVREFIPQIISRLWIEGLVHGNIEREEAVKLIKSVENILKPAPLTQDEKRSHRSLLVPQGERVYNQTVPNPQQPNSAIEYYVEVGDATDAPLRARLALFAHIVSEPVFDVLRTKEQLGYLVFSGARKHIGAMGFRIMIQSERDPVYLESRVNAFLEAVKTLLENMPAEEFEKLKSALIARKLEKAKNLAQESSRYWFWIHSGTYHFWKNEQDAEQLRHITREDVLSFFLRYIHPSSTTRHKLSSHLVSQAIKEPAADASLLDGTEVFEDIDAYKQGTTPGPYAEPVEPLDRSKL